MISLEGGGKIWLRETEMKRDMAREERIVSEKYRASLEYDLF